ncbi:unnamed protein product [Amoebophrya sp. A120]|nr:unnamed protein product [Amoebophrya sp. A120]|eukprot:GSA120T00016221001.1
MSTPGTSSVAVALAPSSQVDFIEMKMMQLSCRAATKAAQKTSRLRWAAAALTLFLSQIMDNDFCCCSLHRKNSTPDHHSGYGLFAFGARTPDHDSTSATGPQLHQQHLATSRGGPAASNKVGPHHHGTYAADTITRDDFVAAMMSPGREVVDGSHSYSPKTTPTRKLDVDGLLHGRTAELQEDDT